MKNQLRWTPSNVVAVLVALWIGATCSGCGGVPTAKRPLIVTVESQHWSAKTVRVLCDTHQLGAVRGVVMGQPQRSRIGLGGCRSVRLRVEALGGEWWMTEHILVEPGDTIALRIGPTLTLSAYMVREP